MGLTLSLGELLVCVGAGWWVVCWREEEEGGGRCQAGKVMMQKYRQKGKDDARGCSARVGVRVPVDHAPCGRSLRLLLVLLRVAPLAFLVGLAGEVKFLDSM